MGRLQYHVCTVREFGPSWGPPVILGNEHDGRYATIHQAIAILAVEVAALASQGAAVAVEYRDGAHYTGASLANDTTLYWSISPCRERLDGWGRCPHEREALEVLVQVKALLGNGSGEERSTPC